MVSLWRRMRLTPGFSIFQSIAEGPGKRLLKMLQRTSCFIYANIAISTCQLILLDYHHAPWQMVICLCRYLLNFGTWPWQSRPSSHEATHSRACTLCPDDVAQKIAKPRYVVTSSASLKVPGKFLHRCHARWQLRRKCWPSFSHARTKQTSHALQSFVCAVGMCLLLCNGFRGTIPFMLIFSLTCRRCVPCQRMAFQATLRSKQMWSSLCLSKELQTLKLQLLPLPRFQLVLQFWT